VVELLLPPGYALNNHIPPKILMDSLEIRILQKIINVLESAFNGFIQISERRGGLMVERIQARQIVPGPEIICVQLQDFPKTGPGLLPLFHLCQGEAKVIPDIEIFGRSLGCLQKILACFPQPLTVYLTMALRGGHILDTACGC
jgi:hypothetical protein